MDDLELNAEVNIEQSQPETFHGFNREEVEDFVGKNSDYYIKKWKISESPQKKAGWNWAAFICGIFWLGYRKMYLNLLSFLGIFIVADLIQLFTNMSLDKNIGIAMGVVLGAAGNVMYFNHMNKKIDKIKVNNFNPDSVKDEIKKAGGSSWLGVGITILMLIGYMFISSILEGILVNFI